MSAARAVNACGTFGNRMLPWGFGRRAGPQSFHIVRNRLERPPQPIDFLRCIGLWVTVRCAGGGQGLALRNPGLHGGRGPHKAGGGATQARKRVPESGSGARAGVGPAAARSARGGSRCGAGSASNPWRHGAAVRRCGRVLRGNRRPRGRRMGRSLALPAALPGRSSY